MTSDARAEEVGTISSSPEPQPNTLRSSHLRDRMERAGGPALRLHEDAEMHSQTPAVQPAAICVSPAAAADMVSREESFLVCPLEIPVPQDYER